MKRANHRWIAGLVAVGASASITGIVFGDNWTNAAGGSWGVGANWSNNVVPSTATFNLNSSGYTVTLPGGESASSLVVQTDNPTLSLSGNTLTMTGGSPLVFLQVAPTNGQVDSLTVNGPGNITGSSPLAVSVGSGGTGQLIVNDATIDADGDGASLSEGSSGSITVENGGVLEQEDDGESTNLAGSITLNDGTLTATGSMSIVGAMLSNGSLLSAGSTLTITGAVTVDNSTLKDSLSSTSFTSGSVTVTNGGIVNSEENLTLPPTTSVISGKLVSGNTTTFSGTTTVQLSASTNNPFVGPHAAYAGILDFTLQNGFTPAIGEQFNVFDFSLTTSGTFSTVNLPTLPSPEAWNTSQLYTTGVITVVPEPTSVGILAIAGLGILPRRRRSLR